MFNNIDGIQMRKLMKLVSRGTIAGGIRILVVKTRLDDPVRLA